MTIPIIPLEYFARVVILAVFLALVVFGLLAPAFKELRHVRRRLRLARDVEAARRSTTHRDPGRPRVLDRATRLRSAAFHRPARSLAALHGLRPSHTGVDLDKEARIARILTVVPPDDDDAA